MTAARGERLRFTILGEGARDYYFVKAFLTATLGKKRVECYRSQTIPGVGSGEQQVRTLFPRELEAARRRPQKEQFWLAVITDGDKFSPARRRVQLDKEAEVCGLAATRSEDKVIVFVPCRNIESWFQWLETGEKLDETKDYKEMFRNAKPTMYGKQLSLKCGSVPRSGFPPSLQDACDQWVRISQGD